MPAAAAARSVAGDGVISPASPPTSTLDSNAGFPPFVARAVWSWARTCAGTTTGAATADGVVIGRPSSPVVALFLALGDDG